MFRVIFLGALFLMASVNTVKAQQQPVSLEITVDIKQNSANLQVVNTTGSISWTIIHNGTDKKRTTNTTNTTIHTLTTGTYFIAVTDEQNQVGNTTFKIEN
jgi:hypothetical protein